MLPATNAKALVRDGAVGAFAKITPEIWLLLIWAALFVGGVTGYPNLLDNERRVAAYALDVLQNGNWIAQHDATGDFMSKPPALTWLVALGSLCTGGLSLFSLYLPSALATLGVAFVILRAGKKYFGARAGLLAALMYLLSYVTDEQLTTARYDGLFTLPVLIGGLAAYRGWKEGRGWFVFWLAMTAGAMVKGPLVFVLSGIGLLACFWERSSGYLFRWRWEHAAGMAVFVAVCGGWLGLVLAQHRAEFVEKMLQRELVSQIVNDAGKHFPFQRVWDAPLSTMVDFLPWSVFGVVGLAKALRRRSANDGRSFERFLACWFLAGLVLFAVAAHQRGRLTWPLMPAFALAAGHQLDLWLTRFSDRLVYRWAAAAAALVILATALNHHVFQRYSARCQQTLAMKNLAGILQRELGDNPPVTYVDAPFAVQFYLGYLRFNTRVSNAVSRLDGTEAAYVVTSDRGAKRMRNAATNRIFTLYTWPTNKEPLIELLSNRPTLARQ